MRLCQHSCATPTGLFCYLFNRFTDWFGNPLPFLGIWWLYKESLHWILLIYWTSFNFIVLHSCYVIIIILYCCCRFLPLPWGSDNCQCHTPFPWGTLRLIYRLFHHGLLSQECGSMIFGCLIVFHLIGLPCFFLLPLCNPQKFFRSCRAGSLSHRLLDFSMIMQLLCNSTIIYLYLLYIIITGFFIEDQLVYQANVHTWSLDMWWYIWS